MTRRLAITILLTVWTAIVAGGISAWLTARAVLLAELDSSIEQRVLTLPQVTAPTNSSGGMAGDRYVVLDALNQTLARPTEAVTRVRPERINAAFVQLPEGRFRRITYRIPGGASGQPRTIIYSSPAHSFDNILRRLAIALASFGVLAGAGAALASIGIARAALRPLKQTSETIGQIDESRLDRRIDAASLPPELRPMAGRLNDMIARLQIAFEQRRRFLADASHELRTPVAAMTTSMEVALRRPRSAAELTDTLQTCLSEARHLRSLVQALLRQVRADAAPAPDQTQAVDAAELLRQIAELTSPLAAERQVRIVPAQNGPVRVMGDPARLRSVILNLVSNAIEYNRPGGIVELSTIGHNGSAQIRVHDDGPGIAAEHLPNLFQPFYRVAPAGDSDGHLGLGLFLVESHVKSMGGACRVESTADEGTTFVVELPSAPMQE